MESVEEKLEHVTLYCCKMIFGCDFGAADKMNKSNSLLS